MVGAAGLLAGAFGLFAGAFGLDEVVAGSNTYGLVEAPLFKGVVVITPGPPPGIVVEFKELNPACKWRTHE